MSVLDLARPEIRALQPYSSARMEAGGGEVFLNANESAWPPIGDAGYGTNRYPQPQPAELVAALAQLYQVGADQVLVGRGSDEAIDLLVRAFCCAGEDAILIQPPTFGMYAVSARIQNAAVLEVSLSADFTLDVDAVLAAVTPAVKLVFICTPNNPTGQIVPLAAIERLLQALSGRALLVVDEAYLEFSEQPSASTLLDRYDHLGVLRTLSKAWALAGVRVGTLLAQAEVIGLLRRIMAPYPLPLPSVAAALAVLAPAGQRAARNHIDIVRSERARLSEALAALPGVKAVLPSQANFLTVRFDAADVAMRCLLERGIVVRDVRKYPGLGDALRITVGTPAENAQVLQALHDGVAGAHASTTGAAS